MFEHDDKEFKRELLKLLKEFVTDFHALAEEKFAAHSATLTLTNFQGDSMPATIVVGGNGAQANFVEWDGLNETGNQVPAIGPVTYSSDNTAVATVDQTGKVTAVAAGTCNISAVDAGNNLSASDVLTVTAAGPGKAVSATMNLAAL